MLKLGPLQHRNLLSNHILMVVARLIVPCPRSHTVSDNGAPPMPIGRCC